MLQIARKMRGSNSKLLQNAVEMAASSSKMLQIARKRTGQEIKKTKRKKKNKPFPIPKFQLDEEIDSWGDKSVLIR